MSTPTQIWQNPQNGETFCFVKVEKSAIKFMIVEGSDNEDWGYPPYLYYEKEGSEFIYNSLPPGTWQLLGKADEISETTARQIVKAIGGEDEDGEFVYYSNYKGGISFEAAEESLASLIRSLGFEPAETILLKLIK